MDYNAIINFLNTLNPNVHFIWIALGTLTVIGTFLDTVMPKLMFVRRVMTIPFLGAFLTFLTKFSPFNFKTPEVTKTPEIN